MEQVFILNADDLRKIINEEITQVYSSFFPEKNKTKKEYLNSNEVEEIFGISNSMLTMDRHRKQGIPYIKKGRSVLYHIDDIRNYLANNKIKVI